MKDGSRGERNLAAAGGTLPTSPSHQRVAARVGASRTLETLGPAALGQVLLAGFFVGKLELKLAKSPREEALRYTTDSGHLKQPDKQESPSVYRKLSRTALTTRNQEYA